MNRRKFLKGLVGGTVLAPVALKLLPAAKAVETAGFGLAPIKAEGAVIAYDSAVGANFAKALWPGVCAWWEAAYKDCPVEHKDLFEPRK